MGYLCSVRPSSDPATAKTGPLLEVALGLSSLEQTNSVPITVLIRLLLLNIGTSTYPLKAREGHWSKYILARNPVAIFYSLCSVTAEGTESNRLGAVSKRGDNALHVTDHSTIYPSFDGSQPTLVTLRNRATSSILRVVSCGL